MKIYFRLLAPVLIAVAVAGCNTGKGGAVSSKPDTFSEIKTPSEKAHVHYLKKNGKEFVYFKGKDLRDYTVVSENENLVVNVRGKQISGSANLEKKSKVLRGITTESSTEGSKVGINLKSKQGFKIYRRPSGLLLALGPGYQEVAEDDLDSLDADVSSSSSIDEDLSNLLTDKAPPETASTDKELNDLMKNVDAKPAADTAMQEQLLVEEDMGRPSNIESIKISKLSDKLEVSIRSDRKVKYKQKESPKGYNQIIVDIPVSKQRQARIRPCDPV